MTEVKGVKLVGVAKVDLALNAKEVPGGREWRSGTVAFDTEGRGWWLVLRSEVLDDVPSTGGVLHDGIRRSKFVKIFLSRWELDEAAVPFVVP